MEDDSDIYAEIVCGSSYAGDFIEELIHLGRSPEEISRGIQAAKLQLSTAGQAQTVQPRPFQ